MIKRLFKHNLHLILIFENIKKYKYETRDFFYKLQFIQEVESLEQGKLPNFSHERPT